MKYAIIHVADIHYRENAHEGAASLMKAFLKDVGRQIQAMPDHQFYIAFAGDIVQAGQDSSSFEAFAREMDSQLGSVGLKKESRIVTPGNHDLSRRAVEDSYDRCSQEYIEHAATESVFNDFIENSSLLSGHFSNFEVFARQFACFNESYQSRGWGCKLNEEIAVYCLNSALCSFGGANGIVDEGRLAIYTRDLVNWCNKTTSPVKILLHHHPMDHLNSWSRTELQHIIEDNFTLCLSGHNHIPEVFYSHVPQKALICTAPPLFCGKDTTLAYSIIVIDNGVPSAIIYREYYRGSFFPSSRLAKAGDGRVELGNPYLRYLREMEVHLKHALEAFKGHSTEFIEPKLSKKREFDDTPNELQKLLDTPCDTLIIAPPQFGLTCLGLHLRLESFKQHRFWLYVDAEHLKARKVDAKIDEELLHYNKERADIKCIVLDSWNAEMLDHVTMVKNISDAYPQVPLIVLSEDTMALDPMGNLAKLNRKFQLLHLQALSRGSMRKLVAGYNGTQHIGEEDVVLSRLAEHMESINVHRTPLNCFTLLRVLDSNYGEKLINKCKLMKAILFVLFTDYESFSHLSEKPEVEECAYVLGCFCKDLVKQSTRSFDAATFATKLRDICTRATIVLNVDAMLEVLLENNILVRYGNEFEFRHRCWIFYFAAEWMCHDDEFKKFVLEKQNYVNYPEIIEFYAGVDGRRTDALQTLLADLTALIDKVDGKIGIDRTFDPLSRLLWNPTDQFIQSTRTQIAEKVESSNLPPDIKDKHADDRYSSAAPYDQSIKKFLNEYSVLSLLHSIKAASRGLRSSPFVEPELKHNLTSAIFQGWEEISRVVFWISPLLAKEGWATLDGFGLILADGFSTNVDRRFIEIIVSVPVNVVRLLKDDLAAKKIGPLIYDCLDSNSSLLQKHLAAVFIAKVRPIGWFDATLNYIDLLNPRSFYLGKILGTLTAEIELGDHENDDENQLKQLVSAVLSKREYAPKVSAKDTRDIELSVVLCEENRMPIDRLLKVDKKRWPSG